MLMASRIYVSFTKVFRYRYFVGKPHSQRMEPLNTLMNLIILLLFILTRFQYIQLTSIKILSVHALENSFTVFYPSKSLTS